MSAVNIFDVHLANHASRQRKELEIWGVNVPPRVAMNDGRLVVIYNRASVARGMYGMGLGDDVVACNIHTQFPFPCMIVCGKREAGFFEGEGFSRGERECWR